MTCNECVHRDVCRFAEGMLTSPITSREDFLAFIEEKSNIRLLGNQYNVGFNDIGIKYYLTQEESENALERSEQNDRP